jgi:uncharacterized membrane protein YjfL (UPF0719 family)
MKQNYDNIQENQQNNGEIKEDFCSACISVPLALAGVGMTGAGSGGNYKKSKKILLWGGLAMVILSILVAVYFLYIRKCNSCLAP